MEFTVDYGRGIGNWNGKREKEKGVGNGNRKKEKGKGIRKRNQEKEIKESK